jgi:hypothetical protein
MTTLRGIVDALKRSDHSSLSGSSGEKSGQISLRSAESGFPEKGHIKLEILRE